MRRLLLLVLLTGLSVAGSGCVIVLGVPDASGHKHVVKIDGELYVADVKNRTLHKIGEVWDSEAAPDEEDAPDRED